MQLSSRSLIKTKYDPRETHFHGTLNEIKKAVTVATVGLTSRKDDAAFDYILNMCIGQI